DLPSQPDGDGDWRRYENAGDEISAQSCIEDVPHRPQTRADASRSTVLRRALLQVAPGAAFTILHCRLSIWPALAHLSEPYHAILTNLYDKQSSDRPHRRQFADQPQQGCVVVDRALICGVGTGIVGIAERTTSFRCDAGLGTVVRTSDEEARQRPATRHRKAMMHVHYRIGPHAGHKALVEMVTT